LQNKPGININKLFLVLVRRLSQNKNGAADMAELSFTLYSNVNNKGGLPSA